MQNVKLGRKPKKIYPKTPLLQNYLSEALLPVLPASADWGKDVVFPWGMMLNDQIGDCTCAGIGHLFQLWNAHWGRNVAVQDADVMSLYETVTGQEGAAYNPANGLNDNGAIEADVIHYVQQNHFAGHRIDAFANIPASRVDLIKACIWLFGAAYVGVELPLSAQDQNMWQVPAGPSLGGDWAPGSWGGHCIILTAYDDNAETFDCVTWGAVKKLTYAWWEAYGDEAWALLSPDWIGTNNLSPTDFNMSQLVADLKLL